jgi:V/A-type H+-transporting ATPase subunit E
MKSDDRNIEALSRAVLREAQGEAEKILADAREKTESIRKQAEEEAAARRAEILEQATREARRIRSEALSTVQLKARTLQLEQREKLLDEVFEAARQQLAILQQSTDYEEIACRLLHEALTHLGIEQALVRADEMTRKYYSEKVLREISKEVGTKIQFGAPLEGGIGVIAETLDGHRQYDNTLETRLVRFRDTLRLPVYHLLMGEPL